MAGSGGVYSSAGGTSAAVWIEDAAITTNLNAALLADAMLKGTSISVASPNGEVVLTGTANSQTQREHAAQSARVLHGVQNVNNKPAINQ